MEKQFKNRMHVFGSVILGLICLLLFGNAVRAAEPAVLSIADISGSGTRYQISLAGYETEENETLQAAVWSEKGGQDDLVWYDMAKDENGVFSASVSPADHKTAGVYDVHVYSCVNNQKSFVDAGTFSVEEMKCGSVTAYNADTARGTCSVAVSDVRAPAGLASIRMAVWSRSNQSDLVWYNAVQGENGSWSADVNIANHGNRYGSYFIHVYAVDPANEYRFLGNTEIRFEPGQGTVTAEKEGSGCRISLTGYQVAGTVNECAFAVWSREGGQDDLTWVTAHRNSDGSYQSYFDADPLKHAGTAEVHAYMTLSDGTKHFVGAGTFYHTGNKCGGIVIEDKNDKNGTCTIKLNGVTSLSGVGRVTCYVWSRDDQSDLFAYEASNTQGDTFSAQMKVSNHPNHTDRFNVHVYITDLSGITEFLTAEFFDLTAVNAEEETSESDVAVKSNGKDGTFTVSVNGSALPAGTKSVVVPVWSRDDQSDIVWYRPKKNSKGVYEISSSIEKHKNTLGLYHVHIYLENKGGKLEFFTGKDIDFRVKADQISIEKTDDAKYKASVKNVVVPGGAVNVRAAVWSEKNGQDDLVWYDAAGKNGSAYTAEIDLNRHKTEGQYHVHVYAKTKNNEMVFLGASDELKDVTAQAAAAGLSVSKNPSYEGEFRIDVTLGDRTWDPEQVRAAVWRKDNQSDLRWITAEKQGTDVWSASFRIGDFNNEFGNYQIHVYGDFGKGNMKFLAGAAEYVEVTNSILVSAPDGSMSRRVKYQNSLVDSVRFAVWTKEGGKDDLVWYDGIEEENGIFYADVKASGHRHNGTYYVEAHPESGAIATAQFSMIDYLEYAIRIAKDDSVGYSQSRRYLNPDVDCSSLVYYALYNNGFSGVLGNSPFYTGSQVYLMQKCGFKVYQYQSVSSLRPGDVLWLRQGGYGHTEIYVGDGMLVGAHDSVVNGVDYPQGGDQTGREVSVDVFKNKGWMYVLRLYE